MMKSGCQICDNVKTDGCCEYKNAEILRSKECDKFVLFNNKTIQGQSSIVDVVQVRITRDGEFMVRRVISPERYSQITTIDCKIKKQYYMVVFEDKIILSSACHTYCYDNEKDIETAKDKLLKSAAANIKRHDDMVRLIYNSHMAIKRLTLRPQECSNASKSDI